uniref:Uncharacterized protein n=1 Tax=Knipowitschia caucasica TaxID=637954 RepID=A0AAV2JHA5_KNICA
MFPRNRANILQKCLHLGHLGRKVVHPCRQPCRHPTLPLRSRGSSGHSRTLRPRGLGSRWQAGRHLRRALIRIQGRQALHAYREWQYRTIGAGVHLVEMDSGETTAERPVTLDITEVTKETPTPASPEQSPEPSSSHAASNERALPQDESVDLGGDLRTPEEDSIATPSESIMDKLNDQMMESVMISDSPNNSEEDEVPAIDSILDAEEEEPTSDLEIPETESLEIGQNSQEIVFSLTDEAAEEKVADDSNKETSSQQDDTGSDIFFDHSDKTSEESVLQELVETKNVSPSQEPIPVCTIFSQGTQPKALVPDGFQPTLIKSPSFGMMTTGVIEEVVTPSKPPAPLICQPSPSLSKFFSDNGQTNPATDFFDSFTAPSSFISVSNPNAELPCSPTPERQLSSTSSSISTPGTALDFGTPTSVFAPTLNDSCKSPHTPAVPVAAGAQPQPFNQLQAVFSGSDDPFATALSLSEVDRRHEAWLPSEETRKILISVGAPQSSPGFVETSRLTMPGLKFDNLQGDAVKDLLLRVLGEQAAGKRQVLTANSVEQSFSGLKQLIAYVCRADCEGAMKRRRREGQSDEEEEMGGSER